MGMSTIAYNALQNSQVSWICCQCGTHNITSSLFSNSTIELTNRFSVLSDISTSDCCKPLSPPLATSSPYKQRDNTKNNNLNNTRSGKSKTDQTKRHTQGAPTSTKIQSIKTMVINFCSTRNKISDLTVCIENYNPDIIIGTEIHLDSSINSSELFPPNYSVIRKDRDFDNSKGGVLIALKSDLIGTHRTDLNSNCEIIWVTIKIQGTKDITIGAFYRSPQFGNTSEYMHELRESIKKIKHSNKKHIWLGGDFNLPDIDWDILGPKPGGNAPGLSKILLVISNDFGLEQIVREPTRINNTLDLFFTTNPTLVERSTIHSTRNK